MGTGHIVGNIDVAQVVLYVFWFFFAGLVFYLNRESRREGYPVVRGPLDPSRPPDGEFLPDVPPAKVFKLPHGGTALAPDHSRAELEIKAEHVPAFPGAPLVPTGDPMKDGVGPASYALRADKPDLTLTGENKIVPLRVAEGFSVAGGDPNPIGMTVVGCDGESPGTIKDVWVDRSEIIIRYLEVELTGGGSVLLPMPFAKVKPSQGEVRVASITAKHFEDVPKLKDSDSVTLLEEDKIAAYYGSGHLFATRVRKEPLI